jgi:membrane-bound metal-dependent hydrolase YbcI (DUF457 family)
VSSPVGHALIGVALARAVTRSGGLRASPLTYVGAVAVSNLPDLDLLLTAVGVPMEEVHRKWSHSVLFLGALGLLALRGWEKILRRERPSQTLAWAAALVSHPFLDALTTRKGSTFGIPLAWPLTDRLWAVERPIYPSPRMDVYLHLGRTWPTFLPELRALGPVALGLVALAEMASPDRAMGRAARRQLLQWRPRFRASPKRPGRRAACGGSDVEVSPC